MSNYEHPHHDRNEAPLAILIAVMLWATSAYHALKFFGSTAMWVYLPGTFAGTFMLFALRKRLLRARPAVSWGLIIAVVAMAVALLVVVYPKANAHFDADGNVRGSDRDEALDMGATALLHGRYPYAEPTYQGSPISPMPGAFILAMPFVLVRSSAYQILFWLPAFALTARAMAKHVSGGAIAALMLVPLWLAEVQEIATGGDYQVDCLYNICIALWLIIAVRKSLAIAVPIAVLMGLALSSRSNYLLTTPPLFAALVVTAGMRRASLLTSAAAATFIAVTLPFYLHDPAHFGPTQMQDKFAELATPITKLPIMLGLAIVAAAGVTLAIAKRRVPAAPGFLWSMFLANVLPIAVASFAEFIFQHRAPLFFRWASMAVPPLILLAVLPIRDLVINNSPTRPPEPDA
jgi:hypothetical protein